MPKTKGIGQNERCDENSSPLNALGREILPRQGLRSKPNFTLSAYSQNSQRERTAAILSGENKKTAAIFTPYFL